MCTVPLCSGFLFPFKPVSPKGGREILTVVHIFLPKQEGGDCHRCAHPSLSREEATVPVVHVPHTEQGGDCHRCTHCYTHPGRRLSPLYTLLSHPREETVTVVHTSPNPERRLSPLYTPRTHPGRRLSPLCISLLPTREKRRD